MHVGRNKWDAYIHKINLKSIRIKTTILTIQHIQTKNERLAFGKTKIVNQFIKKYIFIIKLNVIEQQMLKRRHNT